MANIHREIHRVIPPRPASNRAPSLSDRFPLGRARIVAETPVPPSSFHHRDSTKKSIYHGPPPVLGYRCAHSAPGAEKGGTNEKSSRFVYTSSNRYRETL